MLGKNFIGVILISLSLFFIMGCQKEDGRVIAFIGDSITARWDLQDSFPSFLTENLGRSGAGVEYLDSYSGKMTGKKTVILIGTNDNQKWDKEYIDIYKKAVSNLQASEVIIVSILPRAAKSDRLSINDEIAQLNQDLEKMSVNNGWSYIDAYEMFLQEGQINKNYYSDGLHLSSCGYEVLTSIIREKIR